MRSRCRLLDVRRAMAAAAVVAAATAVVTAGCASALPPLDAGSDLGSAGPESADPVAAQRSLSDGAAWFAERPDLAAVKRSVQSYRAAAIAAPTDADGIIGAVRSLVWLAGHDEPDSRAAHATEAVETAQWCARREPERSDCDYWLALALGVQSDTRRSTAMDGVRQMVRLLRRAIEADPDLEFGGPHRVLARVLINAPGWPTGPGDAEEGLEQARRAIALYPAHPPNQLALAEALAQMGFTAESRAAYEEALSRARSDANRGDPDAGEWAEAAQSGLLEVGGDPRTAR